MAKVLINNVLANPHRNLEVYGYLPDKIESLRESIRKSELWPNMTAVPAAVFDEDNPMDRAGVAELNATLGLEGVYDGEVIQPWGHHRAEAARLEGVTHIQFTFVYLTMDELLMQMVLENKSDYGANMTVFMESINQVKIRLEEMLAECETYADFKANYGNEIFKTKNAFDQAKGEYGVSPAAIVKMLGETWDRKDVGACLMVLKGVDEEVYTRDQIGRIPSARAMGEFDKLSREILKSEVYPDYFKRQFIDTLADITGDPDRGASTRALTNCRENVKKGRHPINSLLRGSNAPFDLVKELDKLTGAADAPFKLDEVEDRDDFQFEGLAGVIEKINGIREKEAAAASGDAPEGDNDATTLDESVDAAAGEDTSESVSTAALDDAEAADLEADPVSSAVSTFSSMSDGFVSVCDEVQAVAGDITDNEVFNEEYEKAFIALAKIGCVVQTKTVLKKLIDQAAKQV